MQDEGDGAVVLLSAQKLFSSLEVAPVTDDTATRQLLQLHISTLELTARLQRLQAGAVRIEMQLHYLDGSTLHVPAAMHVIPGSSGIKPQPLPGEDEVLDQSFGQGQGGVLGGQEDLVVAESKSSPAKLHLQWIVFVVVGPMLVIPVIAAVVMLASWIKILELKRTEASKPSVSKGTHGATSTLGLTSPPSQVLHNCCCLS